MDVAIETRKIMRKALMHYAKEQGLEVKSTQIKLFSDTDESVPRYSILNNFEDIGVEITLKQLMLVPVIDFTGKGMKADMFVEPQIKNIIKRLAKEHKKEINTVSVVVAVNDNECKDIRFILVIDNKPFKLIDLDKILD